MFSKLYIGVAAAALAVSSASAQAPSVQAQFESATLALEAEKWSDALATFEALERRLQSTPRSLALVRVRKAEALMRLRRTDEAEAALTAGLAALPPQDASLREDRLLALINLGEINERSLDYGEALRHFLEAQPLAAPSGMEMRVLRGLIRTRMFYDGKTALADADRAIALAAAQPGDTEKSQAPFRILRGRILMNLGRFREAQAELKRATDALGGLTLTVDAADIAARSDMAIAALLNKRPDEARKYLAYTGAGRVMDAMAKSSQMPSPPCGAEGDLRPEDVAVVEFSIREDGSVGATAPIYSSREGDSALAFARAASAWSWSAEQVKEIPLLFRMLTRVEMRCTTTAERPSIVGILQDDVASWLDASGIAPITLPDGSDAVRAKPLLDELAARERKHGATSPQLIPALTEVAGNVITPREQAANAAERALAIARAAGAPPPVVAALGIRAATTSFVRKGYTPKGKAPNFTSLLGDPSVMGHPRAATAVRLAAADHLYQARGREKEAIAQLTATGETPGLGRNDALRAAALSRLASLYVAAGDTEAAQTTFQDSGLTPGQCALLDAEPRRRGTRTSHTDYPKDALDMGFEGWATAEYDITAQGEPANVRIVNAYPAFVFSKSTEVIANRQKYEPSFRPDGSAGCGGQQMPIVYRIPK